MIGNNAHRDERTIAIENASYRWGYLVLSFGLLVSAAFRGFARGESSWDLLGLVGLGGLVTTVYQSRGRVLSRRWLMMSLAALTLALAIGAVVQLRRG